MKLVLVNWVDSGSFRGWQSLKDITGSAVKHNRSVGWIAKETDEALWLVAHLDDADPGMVAMGCGDLCIPRGAITSVTELAHSPKVLELRHNPITSASGLTEIEEG